MEDVPPPPPLSKFAYYADDIVCSAATRLCQEQIAALSVLTLHFQKHSEKASFICLPTGTGNVGVIATAPYFIAKFDDAVRNILIVSPNKTTARQLHDQLTNLGEPDKVFLIKQGFVPLNRCDMLPSVICRPLTSKWTRMLLTNDIVITNAPKLGDCWGEAWEQLPTDLFQVVIIDEAHHFPTEFWNRIVDHFQGHAKIIFLTTATVQLDER